MLNEDYRQELMNDILNCLEEYGSIGVISDDGYEVARVFIKINDNGVYEIIATAKNPLDGLVEYDIDTIEDVVDFLVVEGATVYFELYR